MKKSIKTSVSGFSAVLALLGTTLNLLTDGNPATNPDWNIVIPAFLTAVGLIFARDHSVTSEAAGLLKPEGTPTP